MGGFSCGDVDFSPTAWHKISRLFCCCCCLVQRVVPFFDEDYIYHGELRDSVVSSITSVHRQDVMQHQQGNGDGLDVSRWWRKKRDLEDSTRLCHKLPQLPVIVLRFCRRHKTHLLNRAINVCHEGGFVEFLRPVVALTSDHFYVLPRGGAGSKMVSHEGWQAWFN